MKTFVIIGNNVVQDTFIKAGLYTFNATIKSHQSTHSVGFKGASGWVDVELPTNPNKFTKAHAIFELKEDVSQISLCRSGASTANPIIVQTPMWTEGNNISTPSPNPADLDETTNNVDIKLSTQILQTNEKIQLIATEEQFNEIGQGGVTAFGMIKVMAGDIELKVGKDGVISSINQSAEEIQINADRIRFTGSVEFENAVKNIFPDAIIIEVGIPYYEFKKAEGSPYAEYEELNIPVYANIRDNREFLNVGAITSNTNITGLSIQQVEANKVRITAQSNLSASAGTVILKVEVKGKKYLADFNFKVIEKPKDGTDGTNGENGRYLSIKGDVLINNPTQSSGVSLRREMFGMSDETLTVWQYRNSSGSLVNFASPYLKQQSINYNSIYFTNDVCEVKCFIRDEPNIYDTHFIHVTRDGESNIIADLDNENQSISVDTDGTHMFGLPISTKFSIYAGTKSLVLDSLAVQSISGVTATAVKETGIVTVTEVAKTVPDKIDLKITGKATVNSIQYTREAYLTINKIKKGEEGESPVLYELQPSVSQIKKLANGTLIPSTISCRLLVTSASGSSSTTTLPFHLSAERSLDNGATWSNYTLGTSINTASINTAVQFRLYQDTSPVTMLDIETIMVVEDGEHGEDGKYLSIKGDVLINNPTQSSGVSLRREMFGMSDETLTVWQYRNSSGSLVNFGSPYLNTQFVAYNSIYFVNDVCEVRCFVRDEPNIYDTLFIHAVRDGKDGEDGVNGKYLSIKGNVLIHNPTSSSSVSLTRELFGLPEPTLVVWQYRNSSGSLVNFINPSNTTQNIPYNSTYFTNDVCEVKCFVGDEPNIYDIHFIHVTRDGKDGEDGRDGVDGKGISIKGSVDNYNQLLGLTGLSAGDAYFNEYDGKLYIWDGFNFPPNGQGILFQGEPGKDGLDGLDGLDGVSISSLIQQYINHHSKTVQPAEDANWLDKMPQYEDGLYMWSRLKMTLSNNQAQYSSYSLLEDFEAMLDSARIKNLIIYGDFAGEMKEIKSSNPVNYYPLGWRVFGLSHDSNGVPSDQNNIAPKIIKINTGLPKGMLAGLRITPKTNLQGIYQNLSSDLVLNEVHTAYVFARKRNASSVAQIRLKYGSIAITEDLTTTWARYVLKFTPTSQRPFEILFNKTGAWTANDEVEISKIQLAQTELIFDYRQFSYVENAFAGSTSIEGGVVATNMVILNNEGGEIKSYVSGIDANPSAFAAGVTAFGTGTEKKNVDLRHDGTGKIGALEIFANGRVSTGNGFEIDEIGKIKATSGEIGGFDISYGRIGVVQSGNNPTTNGMAIYNEFIKFSNNQSSVFLGTNVLPSSSGTTALMRLTDNTGGWGYKYGAIIDVSGATSVDGANNNIALDIVKGVTRGLRWSVLAVNLTSNRTVGRETELVCYLSASGRTVYLPSNPEIGEMKIVTRVNNYNLTVNGNGKTILWGATNSSAAISFGSGHTLSQMALLFRWDGTYWLTAGW